MDQNTYEYASLAAETLGDYPGRSAATQWSAILGQLDGAAYECAVEQMFNEHERTFKLGVEEYIAFADGSILRAGTNKVVVLDDGILRLLTACQDLLEYYGESSHHVSLGHLSSVAADSAMTVLQLDDLLEVVKVSA